MTLLSSGCLYDVVVYSEISDVEDLSLETIVYML